MNGVSYINVTKCVWKWKFSCFGLCCHALQSEHLVGVFCIIGCIVYIYIQFLNAYGIQGIEIELLSQLSGV